MNDAGEILLEQDVRAIVRLLGDAAAMRDPNAQRRYLMQHLGALIEADTWVWAVAPLLEPGRQPVYVYHQTEGFEGDRMSRFLRAVEHPDTGAMTGPFVQMMLAAGGGQVTRERQRIVSDQRYDQSPAKPYWDAAGIGPLLLSARPVTGNGISMVGFYRTTDAVPFTPRETKIAHIVLTEVPWLHETSLPHQISKAVPQLPPRCRMILNQLVCGRTRTEIAKDLAISVETVHGYLKKLYRHFGVHSQPELIARFTRGDGGDA
jgi:DNA-binding CsgD family transcriptional regulator